MCPERMVPGTPGGPIVAYTLGLAAGLIGHAVMRHAEPIKIGFDPFDQWEVRVAARRIEADQGFEHFDGSLHAHRFIASTCSSRIVPDRMYANHNWARWHAPVSVFATEDGPAHRDNGGTYRFVQRIPGKMGKEEGK